jgi:hypothetical protein
MDPGHILAAALLANPNLVYSLVPQSGFGSQSATPQDPNGPVADNTSQAGPGQSYTGNSYQQGLQANPNPDFDKQGHAITAPHSSGGSQTPLDNAHLWQRMARSDYATNNPNAANVARWAQDSYRQAHEQDFAPRLAPKPGDVQDAARQQQQSPVTSLLQMLMGQ